MVAQKSHDNTVQAQVKRLKPNKRYWFRFVGNRGKRSDVGTFMTAPKPSQSKTIKFGWSGDQDFNSQPGQSKPFWNDGGVLRRMKSERNAFNVMLGDTIYSDSEVPGRLNPIALSVKQKWAKYKINLGNKSLRALRGSAGYYSQWDDHEFVNDFSPAENSFDNGVNVNGHTLYRRGIAGLPRLRAGALDEAQTACTGSSAGARTSRSSSSTSAPSAAPTPTRAASATTRRRAAGPGADRASDHPHPVRGGDPVARAAGLAGVPRPHQQPRPHLPRQAPAVALPEGASSAPPRASR